VSETDPCGLDSELLEASNAQGFLLPMVMHFKLGPNLGIFNFQTKPIEL